MHFVIVPGINGSDEEHWQSVWESAWGPSATRIAPSSWDAPDLDDWTAALDRTVAGVDGDVVIVAHSLGCHAATARELRPNVRGLFLVAPPDVTRPDFPREAASFTTLTPSPVPVPGLVVYGEDDPYCEPAVSVRLATGWGLPHVSAGEAGHVNVASGVGGWAFGQALLIAFTAGIRRG
jgi:predicted alpha/beta hydrolase family esterase